MSNFIFVQKPDTYRLACQTIVGDKSNRGKVSLRDCAAYFPLRLLLLLRVSKRSIYVGRYTHACKET